MPSNNNIAEISLDSILGRVNAISLKIHGSVNLTEMLNVAVQQTREILDCDRVIIYQFLPEGDGVIAAESVGAEWTAILGGLTDGSCFSQDLAHLYEAGKFSVIEDTQTKPIQSSYADLLAKMQVRANIVMPILVGAEAQLFGLIIAHQCDRPRQWQSQEISLLQNISTQLAIALRYASKEQLQKSAQKNDTLRQYALKITGDGVWDWHIPSNQVFFCPQWKVMLGFEDSEIRGDLSEWDSRIHPDDRDGAYVDVGKHLRGETEQYINEHRLQCKDGTYKWVLDRGQIVSRASDGSPLRFIGTHVDISDRKQIELALHESEAKLREAKEVAEAATRSKGELLANMSHEIRTPMNGVLGMAKLLSSTSLTEEQSDYVQTIRDSGNILLSVINDILDFSKVESGKLELEKIPFVLEDAIKSVLNLISNQTTNQETIIKYAIAADVPATMLGDRARFSQILINLIGNAAKFSKQGEVLLSISYLNSSQLLFSIKDTGIGISSDRINTLFQPFTQADASISRKYGGTGLGLAICKHLVKLMSGSIWAESKGSVAGEPLLDWQMSTNLETQGAIFCFTIALPNIEPIAIAPISPISGSSDSLTAEQFPLKILIVEDNLVNQKIAFLYLKKFGYLADIANNGAEALNMSSSQTYDLLLMDMQMPVMDGITATKAIRQNAMLQPQPKIVAMTANVMSEDVQSCLKAGMNDYISKPIQIDELVRILTQSQNKH